MLSVRNRYAECAESPHSLGVDSAQKHRGCAVAVPLLCSHLCRRLLVAGRPAFALWPRGRFLVWGKTKKSPPKSALFFTNPARAFAGRQKLNPAKPSQTTRAGTCGIYAYPAACAILHSYSTPPIADFTRGFFLCLSGVARLFFLTFSIFFCILTMQYLV